MTDVRLGVVLFLCACGSDPPAATDGGSDGAIAFDGSVTDGAIADASLDAGEIELAPVPSIALELDRETLVPETEIAIRWTATDAAETELVIAAIAPGDALPPGTAGFISPGVRVATNAARYLASDGTWSETEVAYESAPASGEVSVRLPAVNEGPSLDEGEWRIEARLHQNDEPIAVARRTLLQSSRPMMRLSISRTEAQTIDPVSATLALAPGETETDAVVLAEWIAPDGTTRSIPEGDATRPLVEGAIEGGTFELGTRELDTPGLHRVVARLFDRATGTLHGLAEAGIFVCDEDVRLRGTVHREDGTPLASTTAAFSEIVAIDLSDGATTRATVLPDGSFAIDLRSSRVALLAHVLDETGDYHATSEPLTVAGCGSPALDPIALTAGPPAAVDTDFVRRLRETIGTRSTGDASDGLPQPRLMILGRTTGAMVPVDAQQIEEIASARVFAIAGPDISRRTGHSGIAIARREELTQLLGGMGDANLNRFFEYDFLLVIDASVAGSSTIVNARIVDSRDVVLAASTARGADVLVASDSAIDQLLAMASPSLFTFLRSHQPCPIRPQIELTVPATVAGGAPTSIAIRGRLTDANGRACMRSLTFHHHAPDRAVGDLERVVLALDAAGEATATFPLRGTAGIGNVWAELEDPYTPYRTVSRQYTVTESSGTAGSVSLLLPSVGLRGGATTPVRVSVVDASGIAATAAGVVLATTIGTLESTLVTTDSAGSATVPLMVPAGSSGLGELEATVVGTGVRVRLPFAIAGPADVQLRTPSTTVYDDGELLVSGTVQINGRVAQGVSVALSLTGAGRLSQVGVVTDRLGYFEALYHAPSTGAGTATVRARVVVDGEPASATVSFDHVSGAPRWDSRAGGWVGTVVFSDPCVPSETYRGGSVGIVWIEGRTCGYDEYLFDCPRSIGVGAGSGIADPPDIADDGSVPPLDMPFTVNASLYDGGLTFIASMNDRGLLSGALVTGGGCMKGVRADRTWTFENLRRY